MWFQLIQCCYDTYIHKYLLEWRCSRADTHIYSCSLACTDIHTLPGVHRLQQTHNLHTHCIIELSILSGDGRIAN